MSKKNTSKIVPEKVWFQLTPRCNLNCRRCNSIDGKTEVLDTIEIKDILDDLADYGVSDLVFTGGEPLIREDFSEVASYACFRGFRVTLESNGTLIDEKFAESLKKSGVGKVFINLDSSNADLHDSLRGMTGVFTGALNGFQALKNNDMDTGFNSVIGNRNIDDSKNLIELSERLGAGEIKFFLSLPGGCCSGLEPTDSLLVGQCGEVIDQLCSISRKSNLLLKILCAPEYAGGIDDIAGNYEDISLTDCSPLYGIPWISSDGSLHPCAHKTDAVGNLTVRSFKELWESAAVEKYRQSSGKNGAFRIFALARINRGSG